MKPTYVGDHVNISMHSVSTGETPINETHQQNADNWSSSASLVFSDRSLVLINSLRLRGLIAILKTRVLAVLQQLQ